VFAEEAQAERIENADIDEVSAEADDPKGKEVSWQKPSDSLVDAEQWRCHSGLPKFALFEPQLG
jgi:hypothetical protein